MSTAEVAVEAQGWAFGRWVIMFADAGVEMEELVKAGEVGVIWWFIIVP